MGYNLKNAGNASRILELKSKFLAEIKGFVWEHGLALQQLFPRKTYFKKIQAVIKSQSFMTGTSNLNILIFSTCFYSP